MLDAEVRQDLRGLSKDSADLTARHLVMTGRLLDEEPAQALAHARAASALAGRIGAVREATGLAAYAAEEWAEALSELRAARRLSGRSDHLAVMADCERALQRPERALAVLEDPDVPRLEQAARVELVIVVAGARRDLGQPDAAVLLLQGPARATTSRRPWAARLWYAFADALLAAERQDEAREWFAKAAEQDGQGETDAMERLLELDGVVLEDLQVGGDETTRTRRSRWRWTCRRCSPLPVTPPPRPSMPLPLAPRRLRRVPRTRTRLRKVTPRTSRRRWRRTPTARPPAHRSPSLRPPVACSSPAAVRSRSAVRHGSAGPAGHLHPGRRRGRRLRGVARRRRAQRAAASTGPAPAPAWGRPRRHDDRVHPEGAAGGRYGREIRQAGRQSHGQATRVRPGATTSAWSGGCRRPRRPGCCPAATRSSPGGWWCNGLLASRGARTSTVSVDTVDCVAWSATVQRSVSGCAAGDVVRVRGALRRRFWRTGGGAASRCEVEVAGRAPRHAPGPTAVPGARRSSGVAVVAQDQTRARLRA